VSSNDPPSTWEYAWRATTRTGLGSVLTKNNKQPFSVTRSSSARKPCPLATVLTVKCPVVLIALPGRFDLGFCPLGFFTICVVLRCAFKFSSLPPEQTDRRSLVPIWSRVGTDSAADRTDHARTKVFSDAERTRRPCPQSQSVIGLLASQCHLSSHTNKDPDDLCRSPLHRGCAVHQVSRCQT
jgi:hypothetical protein